MVEHYRSDFNITDIVHIKKKEKKCYKYASGTVRVIDIFAICKISKPFFLVCIMKKTTKIEMKDVLKF